MAWRDLITWNRKKQPQAQSELQHPVATLHREVDRLFDGVCQEYCVNLISYFTNKALSSHQSELIIVQ